MVEDTDDNRMLVKNYLSRFDYLQVDEAINGVEAIQLVKSKKYHLVLMDMRMPEMNGDEATRKIRGMKDEYFKKLPIIALTADTYGIEKSDGFTELIIKPYKFPHLKGVIDKYAPADR